MASKLPSEAEILTAFRRADMDFSGVIQTISNWWNDALRHDELFTANSPTTLPDVVEQIGVPFPMDEGSVPQPVARGLDELIREKKNTSDATIVANCILARGLGVALAGNPPDRALFDESVVYRTWLPGREIGAGLSQELEEGERTEWAKVLVAWKGTLEENSYRHTPNARSNLQQRAADWAEDPDFATLLAGLRRPSMPSEKVLRRLSVLTSLSLPHFFAALAKFPLPDFMWQVFRRTYLFNCWEALFTIVSSAPQTFDPDGQWQPERPALFLAIRAAIERVNDADRRAGPSTAEIDLRPEESQPDSEAETERQRLDSLLEIAFTEREDGVYTGAEVAGFIQRRQYRHTLRKAPSNASSEATILEKIVEILADLEGSPETLLDIHARKVEQAVQLDGEAGEVFGSAPVVRAEETLSYLLLTTKSTLEVEPEDDTTFIPSLAPRIWSEYASTVRDRDPAFKRLMTNFSEVRYLIDGNISPLGYIASKLDEPRAQWKRTWDLLEPHRYRSSFSTYQGEISTLNPSVYHIRLGLDLAYYLARDDDAAARETVGAWESAYRAAIELWQRMRVQKAFQIEPFVASCLSYYPHVVDNEVSSDRVHELLSQVQHEPRILVRGCSNLRRQGVESSVLSEALSALEKSYSKELSRFDWLTAVDVSAATHLTKLADELSAVE